HHQIDLIEIDAAAIEPRPADGPLCGDLTVAMPLPDVDLDEARSALAAFFGDRLEVCTGGTPWATLHIATSAWPAVATFLTDVLGVPLQPLDEGTYRLIGIGGRIDVTVSSATVVVPPQPGKRYPGASHLRLLHRDLAAIDAAAAGRDDVRWILPPEGGFGFIAGP